MNKNEILEKIKNTKLKTEKLHIIDWDADIYIKEMTGYIYSNISGLSVKNGELNNTEFLNRAIVESCFDSNGEQIFSNDDLDMIGNLSGDIYSSLVSVITKLNNINGASNRKN